MNLSVVELNKTYVCIERQLSVKSFYRTERVVKKALLEVTFTLKEGLYGLLGPNGAGKSTLMKIIAGIMLPDSGQVLWDGKNILKLGKGYRKLLGFMPQQQGLYDCFTGRCFLDYMCVLKEIPPNQANSEIMRVAEIVHLSMELNKRLGAYSGGMKQRILLAAALLGNPMLLILDEPTAGLDPRERVSLRLKLKELSREKIILIATHVVSDVESVADGILILKEGCLIEKGSVESLKKSYRGAQTIEDIYLMLFGDEKVDGL